MKSILLEDDIHKKLKVLSANSGKNIKFLLVEALNLLFHKYQEELKNGKSTV